MGSLKNIPQGLKPAVYAPFYGTTEVVPLQNVGISASSEVVPLQNVGHFGKF